MVGEFRRNSDECDALGFGCLKVILEGSQGDVTVQAQFSTVEGDKDWSLSKEIGEGDVLAGGVFQDEVGEGVASFEG